MLYYNCKVTRVIDGGTIVVDMNLGMGVWLHQIHVQLNAVDAPELHGPDKERGINARDYLKLLVLKTHVNIETIDDRRDKYGRLVANVILIEGSEFVNRSVNRILIEKGFAVPYIGDMFEGVPCEA